jgi:hypothetical protein
MLLNGKINTIPPKSEQNKKSLKIKMSYRVKEIEYISIKQKYDSYLIDVKFKPRCNQFLTWFFTIIQNERIKIRNERNIPTKHTEHDTDIFYNHTSELNYINHDIKFEIFKKTDPANNVHAITLEIYFSLNNKFFENKTHEGNITVVQPVIIYERMFSIQSLINITVLKIIKENNYLLINDIIYSKEMILKDYIKGAAIFHLKHEVYFKKNLIYFISRYKENKGFITDLIFSFKLGKIVILSVVNITTIKYTM